MNRDCLKSIWNEEEISDQEKKIPQPPLYKEATSHQVIDLSLDFEPLELDDNFDTLLKRRKTYRIYSDESLSLLELSFLLYSAQGVKDMRGKSYATLRTVPSGGARHAFELYFYSRKVEDLEPGIYHYLPKKHQIEFLGPCNDEQLNDSSDDQAWVKKSALMFYIAMIPYRIEWRYGTHSYRLGLIDLGHVGQNIYLACAALQLGTCGIGAFNQKLCDQLLGLDGEDEFCVYLQPVGKLREKDLIHENDLYRFVEEEGL